MDKSNSLIFVKCDGKMLRQTLNIMRQIHVKCNALRQKKHRHLEKNRNEHDLGVYDSPMNI
jgi:hypothetical protein